MSEKDKDTSAYVVMPRLEISPETEVYLRNTSYLQLLEDYQQAVSFLQQAYNWLYEDVPMFYKKEDFKKVLKNFLDSQNESK